MELTLIQVIFAYIRSYLHNCKTRFQIGTRSNKYGDVWEITQEMNNPHPAPFPTELIDRIVSSTKATLILDPFAGSGTTGVAATNNNRDYILIDNSEKYCKLAKTRLEGGNWNEQ